MLSLLIIHLVQILVNPKFPAGNFRTSAGQCEYAVSPKPRLSALVHFVVNEDTPNSQCFLQETLAGHKIDDYEASASQPQSVRRTDRAAVGTNLVPLEISGRGPFIDAIRWPGCEMTRDLANSGDRVRSSND
jgi:hypothetical protein